MRLLVVERLEAVVQAPVIGQQRSTFGRSQVEGKPRTLAFGDAFPIQIGQVGVVVEQGRKQIVVDRAHGFGVGVNEANPIQFGRHARCKGYSLEAVFEGRAVLGISAQACLQLLEGLGFVQRAEGDALQGGHIAFEIVVPNLQLDVGGPELQEGLGEAATIGFPAARPDSGYDLSVHCGRHPLIRSSRSCQRV